MGTRCEHQIVDREAIRSLDVLNQWAASLKIDGLLAEAMLMSDAFGDEIVDGIGSEFACVG
jgi:hypothetical protein